ncbi:DNA methyltransferase [Geitlerinema sp. PCC 9228]|jgi:site-specific DNA-methyltransferase (adenine-specific)|uniref:DNA-methyltransferase n=1 Tax=Geitlerinema sp. PCC 9228 TaxID=111611 RepID=UPI0008F9A294
MLKIPNNYTFFKNGEATGIHADCLEFLGQLSENSIHAIVTDPPYGVKEYDFDQLKKLSKGNGGVWRIPPSFDGNIRSPLPRFTALNEQERCQIRRFFIEWTKTIMKPLVPGGHVFIATNSFLSPLVFEALSSGGLEYRSTLIRLVRTMRGGDKPKNAESEFPDVCSLPRGCYEPWGIFRKPLPAKMTLAECLKEYKTGGLRRISSSIPFEDVIPSERTPKFERKIANHPSLKPQSFMRKIVYAALPLGEGIVMDPFMGSGSTLAAAEAVGYSSVGTERFESYYQMAEQAVPKLKSIHANDLEGQLSLSL